MYFVQLNTKKVPIFDSFVLVYGTQPYTLEPSCVLVKERSHVSCLFSVLITCNSERGSLTIGLIRADRCATPGHRDTRCSRTKHESSGLGVRHTWVRISALLFTSCETREEISSSLSFLTCKMGLREIKPQRCLLKDSMQ